MQYYTFERDKESQYLCTICTPSGMYKYTRLPMGLKYSPHFSQAAMENILCGIEECDVYINYVGIFTNSWEDHIKALDFILKQLSENFFTINPLKCGWSIKETDWLGYWLTLRCLKPWRKNIKSVLHMDRPCMPNGLIMLIGCVNYYRDMWPICAHILKPLTDKYGLKKKYRIKWTDKMQKSFDKRCLLMA